MRRPLEMAIMGAFCGGGGHEGRANREAIRALLLVKEGCRGDETAIKAFVEVTQPEYCITVVEYSIGVRTLILFGKKLSTKS